MVDRYLWTRSVLMARRVFAFLITVGPWAAVALYYPGKTLRGQESVMDVNEFRVRPVVRYNLTRYHSTFDGDGRFSGGSESLGEFASLEAAERVGLAMHAATPGSTYSTVDTSNQQIGGARPDQFSLGAQMRNEALFAKIGDPPSR